MSSILDFNYPETILAWEQNINSCQFGSNFTDATLFANEIVHCKENIQANLDIGNTGTTLITGLSIDVFIDSTYHNSINWNHILPPNTNTNSTPFPINFLSNELNGDYIEFIINTAQDVNPTNNRDLHNLNDTQSTSSTDLSIEIVMDNYPNDINWFLTNSTNDLLLAGTGADYNPYEEIEITTQLDSNDCYTFTITDSYGDGLCCAFGEGSFNLTSNGDTLASGGNFGEYYIQSFYVGNEIGITENNKSTKRIVNRSYFNLVGQEIIYPSQTGIYIQQTLFEDGSSESTKMILTNTKL